MGKDQWLPLLKKVMAKKKDTEMMEKGRKAIGQSLVSKNRKNPLQTG